MFTNFTNSVRNIRGFIRANSREGFTITELLVAMGIFAIFLTIAFGVFVQSVKDQRQLTRFFAVQNNAGLVVEQLIREVRTGYWFCPGAAADPVSPCEGESSSLSFVNHNGAAVTLSLNGTTGAVERNGTPLTSSVVRVSGLKFFTTQRGDTCVPPRVTITMQVELAGQGQVPPLNLETSVSSRVFPIEVKGAPEGTIFSCPRV